MQDLARRWADYQAAPIDAAIAASDDMFHGSREHYFAVGRSAIEMISDAMLLQRRTGFARILDLPCGGGRVTRHLRAFFPNAEIAVSDLDKTKQAAVVAQFGVEGIDVAPDFKGTPERHFDLIFVGSLLTHFDEPMVHRALDFFLRSLTADGIAVLTLHGRTTLRLFASQEVYRSQYRGIAGPLARSGFAHYGDPFHGTCFTLASWFCRQIEARADAQIVMFKEGAWDGNQDAIVVRRSEGEWTPAWKGESPWRRLVRHLTPNKTKGANG
ncbi:MAG: class I SAM-dependent methyltransferase [Hyphomicrobiales bacterium]|nr:class I SAM-dependent methyltransferase [Hyphomicrobiales bacterium]